jgi:hypothetical protein
MVYALSKVCLDETAKTYWSCKDLMCEQETKPEQFNREELLWIWYAVMSIDRKIFDSAPYSLKELEKLQERLDCMVGIKS